MTANVKLLGISVTSALPSSRFPSTQPRRPFPSRRPCTNPHAQRQAVREFSECRGRQRALGRSGGCRKEEGARWGGAAGSPRGREEGDEVTRWAPAPSSRGWLLREREGGGGVCLRAPTVRPGPPALWQIPLHSPLSPFLPAGRTPLGLQSAARGLTGAPCAQESASSRPGVVEDRAGRFLPGPSRGWQEGQSSGAPAREARTGAQRGGGARGHTAPG